MSQQIATRGSRLDVLIGSKYSILTFSQLALPYKLAIAHWMAFDGEAWADVLPPGLWRIDDVHKRQVLLEAMPYFDAKYGDELFGVVQLASQAVCESAMHDVDQAESFSDWRDYHAWYISAGPVPEHPATDRWPVILSEDPSETLQDGWHRLHCYLKRGDETIPAVFYPRARHLRAKGLERPHLSLL